MGSFFDKSWRSPTIITPADNPRYYRRALKLSSGLKPRSTKKKTQRVMASVSELFGSAAACS